jgi:hypothetical protein
MSTIPSTTILTNLKTATPPTANTLKSAAIAGVDMTGMIALVYSKALELKACLALIVRATDGADPNLTMLDDVLASLT